MFNKRNGAAIAFLAIAMLLISSILIIGGCGTQDNEQIPGDYTVEVRTSGGMAHDGAEMTVCSGGSMQDLVWKGQTDGEGKASFKAPSSEGCVLLISGLANGYQAEEYYPIIAGYNEIITHTVIRDDAELDEINYKIGDVVCDFTVTATNGNEYRISDLLKEKKAVVLNFWFINCGPCRMEFPYLQQAYEEYSDKIEVLALNPVDGTDEKIALYAEENSLGFPMASVSFDWESAMNIHGYPTTVVIDRYGMISFIHTGSITEKDTFVRLFEYYSSDDYVQATIRSIDDIVE